LVGLFQHDGFDTPPQQRRCSGKTARPGTDNDCLSVAVTTVPRRPVCDFAVDSH
jgi:hypothetical protein